MNLQYQNHNVPRLQTQSEPDPPRRSKFLTVEPPSSSFVVGREAPGPPLPNCEDPDGEPLNEQDPELVRKKKMLQKLNERILHKKAAIAIKAVKASVKDPSIPDDSYGEQMNVCKAGTLRDRVMQISLQRQSSLYSKFLSSKERSKSSTLSKESLHQEQHPLKLRVKALRMHRLSHSSVLPSNKDKVPVVPPSSRRITSPEEEKSSSNKGFERFVKMLNEGADTNFMDLVSDMQLPPPRQNIISPVRQEVSSNKGFELLLGVLNKGEDPKIKDAVPDIPLHPPRKSLTSPVKQESSSGFERLSVHNKGADSRLKDSVPDAPVPPSVRTKTSAVRQESSSSKGFDLLLGVMKKGAETKDTAPDVPLPPPRQSIASPAKEKTVEKGFECFLSLLNKGVDITLLTKIAKDDQEDPNLPVTNVKTESDLFFRKGSQPSGSGSCSRISSAESKTDPPHQVEPLSEVKKEKTATQVSSLDPCRQSKSPVSVKKKKEEEGNPNLDEKHEQLQSILESLGLNLNFEDLSKLSDRTEERLYGKKREKSSTRERSGERNRSREREKISYDRERSRDDRERSHDGDRRSERDRRSDDGDRRSERDRRYQRQKSGERERRSERESRYEKERSSEREKTYSKARLHKKHTKSRSSSSSSTSRSRSKSRNPTRSRNKRSRSHERSQGRLRHCDKEVQRQDRKDEAFSFPHTADYNSYQYAQYINYCNTYSTAVNPYWFYQQNNSNLLLVSPEQYAIPQHSSDGGGVYPYLGYNSFKDAVDPDLALTEGQSGVGSSCCLKAVDTKVSLRHYEDKPMKNVRQETREAGWHQRKISSAGRSDESSKEKKEGPREVISSKVKALLEKGHRLEAGSEEQKPPIQQGNVSVQSLDRSVGLAASSSGARNRTDSSRPERTCVPKAKQPINKKSQTEEEIKAMLRQKLMDFNQKAKEMTKPQNSSIRQPEDPLASELS